MYVVFLNYVRPVDEVEALLAAHIEWLDRYFEAGCFIAAGRKDPRTGGMLLVRDIERERLDAILAEDPFVAVAQYEVTKVNVTRAAEAFAGLNAV
ncbi:YciI family protein [Pantoea sp. GD03673]|uniref:YciI family protein n=1 Tax=Pantoea sp. GD03673 TaxID=2975364 RepID=UPI00244D1570|nr:YciI family protein [Pantoea sp. GD03673]MDH2068107.1 YciI family protein [Pantoea sp. GD03673]